MTVPFREAEATIAANDSRGYRKLKVPQRVYAPNPHPDLPTILRLQGARRA